MPPTVHSGSGSPSSTPIAKIANVAVSLGKTASRAFIKCTIYNLEKVVYQSRLYEGDMYRTDARGILDKFKATLPEEEENKWRRLFDMLDARRQSLVLFTEYRSLASELVAVSNADQYRTEAKILYEKARIVLASLSARSPPRQTEPATEDESNENVSNVTTDGPSAVEAESLPSPPAPTIVSRSATIMSDVSSSAGNTLQLRLNRRRGQQNTSSSRHTLGGLSFLRRLSTVSLPSNNYRLAVILPPEAEEGTAASPAQFNDGAPETHVSEWNTADTQD